MKTKKHPVIESHTNASWKPKLTGGYYCSPACGGRCTRRDYDRAVAGSLKLVKKLQGPTWEAVVWENVVWENVGWHFKAVAGPLVVFGDYHGYRGAARFACSMLGRAPDNFTSKDPNEAVAYTVSHCIDGASRSLTALFAACEASDMKAEFFRAFSQLPAIEFLRFPGGRSKADAELEAMVKDRKVMKTRKTEDGK